MYVQPEQQEQQVQQQQNLASCGCALGVQPAYFSGLRWVKRVRKDHQKVHTDCDPAG